jgi:3-mercaptopyruvate sulfurtransferase SseA
VLYQPDTRYVLFCAGGLRSALAARTMQEMGVAQVAHIEGGFGAWRAAGAPVAEAPRKISRRPGLSARRQTPTLQGYRSNRLTAYRLRAG